MTSGCEDCRHTDQDHEVHCPGLHSEHLRRRWKRRSVLSLLVLVSI